MLDLQMTDHAVVIKLDSIVYQVQMYCQASMS